MHRIEALQATESAGKIHSKAYYVLTSLKAGLQAARREREKASPTAVLVSQPHPANHAGPLPVNVSLKLTQMQTNHTFIDKTLNPKPYFHRHYWRVPLPFYGCGNVT